MKLIWEQADVDEPEIVVRGRLKDKKTAELIKPFKGLWKRKRT